MADPQNPTTTAIQPPEIFLKTPLTHSLLTNPIYTQHPTSTPKYHFVDPFFRQTSHANSAILQTAIVSRASPTPEGHLLIHCGRGVCGNAGIAHGGFLATVMDEACGVMVLGAGLDDGVGMFTVRLDMGYRKPVLVADREGEGGTVIVASARLEKIEGRKVFIKTEIRNEKGEVCTTADAVFVKQRPAAL